MIGKKIKVTAIAGMDQGRVIGINGKLPWNIPEDMKHFAAMTRGHAVVMGRKTFDSLPQKFKPLPGRKNIIVSKSVSSYAEYPDVLVSNSLESLYSDLESEKIKLDTEQLWIIGGEQIYRATMPIWDEVCLTYIKENHQGDAFFPEFEEEFDIYKRIDNDGFSFLFYKRP